MGKIKEAIPDYVWDWPEEKIEKYFLKENLKLLVSKEKAAKNKELYEFLEWVTPLKGPDYFLYAKDQSGTYTNIKFNRQDYIDALCCLSEEKITLFYHIASFDGWIGNDDAVATRCLYVDIDDVGINANESDIDTVLSFLRDNLKLSDEQFPDYAVLSGHGLHAVWLISELSAEDEELRMKYTGSLITRTCGDFSGAPISHQYRCPCSYNLKDEVIKGRIFKLTDCNNRDIHRLDWCLLPSEEIEEYRSGYYKRVYEKNLQTKEKNKQLEKEFLENLGNTTLYEYLSRTDISDKNRALAEKVLAIHKRKKSAEKLMRLSGSTDNDTLSQEELDLYIYLDKALPFAHLKPYDNFKSQNRTWNIILDLHNFFIRHKGILVSRNMFFTILANLFKVAEQSDRAAINWCKRYVDAEYFDEMVSIIEQVYNNNKVRRIPNFVIASHLCFTPEDIEKSHCCFSEERRAQAKKDRDKKQYKKKRAEVGKLSNEERKQLQLEYLRAHPDIKDKEAMKALGICRSSFYTLKKLL